MSSQVSDFEQEYTHIFKGLALNYGEFLYYERDQSHRDIGLHLKKKHGKGSATASSLVFFQLKGVMKTTLSKKEAEAFEEYPFQVEVKHLQRWYKYDTPTYFSLYVESLQQFYYVNIRDWVQKNYGPKIFAIEQNTITVHIPFRAENKLDEESFEKMFVKGESLGWEKLVGDIDIVNIDGKEKKDIFEDCLYQHNLLTKIAQIEDKGGIVDVIFANWQSKTRGEVLFFDPLDEMNQTSKKYVMSTFGDDRDPFHVHWQYMLSAESVEQEFYFLDFHQDEEARDVSMDECGGTMKFSNGCIAYGEDCYGELIRYKLSAKINAVGKALLKWIRRMEGAGIIVPSEDCAWISKAYWHRKEI